MKKLYLANDLFNEATQDYNEKIARELEEAFSDELTLYVPQRNEAINDKNAYADSLMIAEGDYNELSESDILLAVLDTDDSGVAAEVALAYEKGIPIVGLLTDVRQFGATNAQKIAALSVPGENQFFYSNLMVIGFVKKGGTLVTTRADALFEIQKLI